MDKIVGFLVEGKFLKKTIEYLDKIIAQIGIWVLSRTIKVDPKKVFFITFRGDYDCNAKWIAEELATREEYKLVWAIRKKTSPELNDFPMKMKLVVRGEYDYYKEISSARIIIDNGISVIHNGYHKKKDQILMQTWHGSLGIKRFSPDTMNDPIWIKKAYKESRETDYCISNSTFENDIYREYYWKNNEILMYGHARNDILFPGNEKRQKAIKEKIYQHYGIKEDYKVCLYAPTFRDDGDLRPYMIDYNGLSQALSMRFGGNWVIATRFHFRIIKKAQKLITGGNVIDMCDYPDIQEILTCIDVGITDYSSWICEYMLARKPGFIFATDADTYEDSDRELFYPLTDLPFPVAVNNDQLIDNILSFDNEKFVARCEEFLKDKGCIDDGMAAKRIADKIDELTKKGE